MSAPDPPAALVRALHNLRHSCPDCWLSTSGIEWASSAQCWKVVVYHDATCPALRSAQIRRAVNLYLADLVNAEYHLSHYEVGEELIAWHRRGRAKVG